MNHGKQKPYLSIKWQPDEYYSWMAIDTPVDDYPVCSRLVTLGGWPTPSMDEP